MRRGRRKLKKKKKEKRGRKGWGRGREGEKERRQKRQEEEEEDEKKEETANEGVQWAQLTGGRDRHGFQADSQSAHSTGLGGVAMNDVKRTVHRLQPVRVEHGDATIGRHSIWTHAGHPQHLSSICRWILLLPLPPLPSTSTLLLLEVCIAGQLH